MVLENCAMQFQALSNQNLDINDFRSTEIYHISENN